MADSRAGLWIIGLCMYFFLFYIVSLAVVNTMGDEYVTVNDDRIQYLSTQDFDGYCDNYYSPTPARYIDNNRIGIRDINCAKLGIDDDTTCNGLAGCNWTNTSTFLFFWEVEVPAFCDGEINLTAYHNETIDTLGTFSSYDVCRVNNASGSEALCSTFGCQYYEYGVDAVTINYLWNAVQFMFTFSVDIDSPNEYAFILSFFFTWLPLLALVLAIYYTLPFI